MMLRSRTFVGCIALLALGCAGAEARIVCREGFQVVGGREISTPYCNDNYLAEVARARGIAVSDEAVRNSPSLKDEVCRQIGRDIRIQHYCDTDSGPDGSR
jgi:hypothetical protein